MVERGKITPAEAGARELGTKMKQSTFSVNSLHELMVAYFVNYGLIRLSCTC